eukprot:14006915-Alexandrium_andersonii.AAC.1
MAVLMLLCHSVPPPCAHTTCAAALMLYKQQARCVGAVNLKSACTCLLLRCMRASAGVNLGEPPRRSLMKS